MPSSSGHENGSVRNGITSAGSGTTNGSSHGSGPGGCQGTSSMPGQRAALSGKQ